MMKINLSLAVAVPILFGTVIGVIISGIVLKESLETFHITEINNVGDDLTSDVQKTYTEFEENVFLNMMRFSGAADFREALKSGDRIKAVQSFIPITKDLLPVDASLVYVNRGEKLSWLNSATLLRESHNARVVNFIEQNSVLQSAVFANTSLRGPRSSVLIFSTSIAAPKSFDTIGTLRLVYEFGPGSALLDYIMNEANVECIKTFTNGKQSAWAGPAACHQELSGALNGNILDNLPFRQLVGSFIVAGGSKDHDSIRNLELISARKTILNETHRTQVILTVGLVISSVLITGMISTIVASALVRSSIRRLLLVIGQDMMSEHQNHPDFIISEFQQISQKHKYSKEELLKLNTQLVNTNREQSELTYAISHDIKSPIITILFLLDEIELCLEDRLDDDTREIIADMKDTGVRMQILIDAILAYARSVGEDIELADTDLNVILDEIRTDIQGEMRIKSAELRIGPMPVVHVNSAQIRLLMQNLISNALKFTHKDRIPIIEVSASIATNSIGHEVTIKVSDNGIGIAQEHHEQVFGLFSRLHNYATYQGSGIGLAICQRVVSNHQGRIEVESEEGKGTTFKITLPT